MCIERNRHILFCGWAKKLYLAIGRQVQRHATCPAKSYYPCHTHHSGFSSLRLNAVLADLLGATFSVNGQRAWLACCLRSEACPRLHLADRTSCRPAPTHRLASIRDCRFEQKVC